MSYDSAKYIYPTAKSGAVFSWGIVNNSPPTHMADNYMPYGINFRLDGQSVRKRPGYADFVTVGGTAHPRGIFSYLRNDTTADRLIVRQNVDATHKLVSITESGTQTPIVTGVTITETTIAFNGTTGRITDSANWLLAAGFTAWDEITVTWSASNDWTYTIVSVNDAYIQLIGFVLTTEAAWADITITTDRVSSNTRMQSTNIGDFLYTMDWAEMWKLNGVTYSNVPLVRVLDSSNNISFNASSRTISDSLDSFLEKRFTAGMQVTITGSASNNKTVTIKSVTAGTLTLIDTDTLVDEAAWAGQVTLTSNSAKPSFGVVFAGCQWIGGFTWAGATNQVWKSNTISPEDFIGAGSDKFTFPENVTAMIASTQAIVVFTENTIHIADLGSQTETAGVVSFSFRTLQTTEWTKSSASVVSVGSNIYYLSTSNKMCMIARGSSINGFEVLEISDIKYKGITPLTLSLEKNQYDSFAQYYPEQSLIKWHLKNRGSTINDVCIIYDVEKDMFLQDTAKYFYDGTYFNSQVYTVSNITPTVFYDEYGRDDNGSAINFDVWTKAFDEWEYTLKKGYWESRTDIAMSPLASLTQEIYINSWVNIKWVSYGQLVDSITVNGSYLNVEAGGGIGSEMTWTFPVGMEWASEVRDMYSLTILRTKGNLNIRWYSIQFHYTESEIWSEVQLIRLGYKAEILPSITTNLTQPIS